MVSGSFHSAPCGPFHLSLTVLVRYRSPSSIQPCRMVPAGSGRVSPAPPYSGYRPACRNCVYGAVTLCGGVFQTPSTSYGTHCAGPTTPGRTRPGLGLSAFARHYLRNHCCFLLLRVLRCFSSPGCSHVNVVAALHAAGLPHSDTCGSRVVCTSPQLFAAYRVLRHLWEPRHPPCALAPIDPRCGF